MQDLRLQLAHWPEPSGRPVRLTDAFVVDTCLRRMALTSSGDLSSLAAPELYTGREAYRFLLEVVTGLRSRIPGETNIQGQVQRAWRTFTRNAPPQVVNELGAVIPRALSDAARLHKTHLQGIGGASYGSLLRKLIRPARDERVLFVGTGELTASLMPYFERQQRGGWNHRSREQNPRFDRLFAPQACRAAASWADHVVMTTPPDKANDQRWQELLNQAAPMSVTQLGHRRNQAVAYRALRQFHLDHLFELRDRQDDVRSLQLERARLACAKTAALAVCESPAGPQRARA
jgi:hypothetical protein